MAKKHIIVIDGNSIMHANHSANKLTVGGMEVQAIFGFLKSLRALLQRTPGRPELLCLWDGKAQFRLDLFPEYKGNRTAKTPEEEADKAAFRRQAPYLEKALTLLGVRQMRSPLLEADDLAGHFVPMLSKAGYQVTMLTGDKDWLQLVDENVTWVDPIRDRSCDHAGFLDFTGYFTPEAFVQGKALQTDVSDNVNGIVGLGNGTAKLILAKWKDVNKFFEAVDDGTYAPASRKAKDAKSLHPEQLLAAPEGRATFERNMKLMDLKQSRKPEPGEIVSTPGQPDAGKFLRLCEALAFASILREQTMFLQAFNINNVKEVA